MFNQVKWTWSNMESEHIITKIKNHALNRVEKYLACLSVRDQQVLINHVIRYYDYHYDLSLQDSEESNKYLNLIDFSFPIIFRYLYKDYSNVNGCPLIPSSYNSVKSVEDLLNICFKAGIMENYEDLLRSGILKYEAVSEKNIRLSYTNKYFSVERFERAQSVKYSHGIMKSMESEYEKGLPQLLPIIKKMEKLVYTWNENFIGYEADPDVDLFFIRNAQLDFLQATEWDGFSPSSKFGGIEYHFFLSALIAIESICIKHLQFVEVAMKKDPNLKKYNILPCLVDYEKLADSLSYILKTSQDVTERILNMFVFSEAKREYYNYIGIPIPPFIKVSSTQLLRSLTGGIYRPIDFMMSELKRQYPKDWERNTKEREALFREELYQYFKEDQFITINRSIDIIEAGKKVTDIDACIIDKKTKEIAFIQLKWQESIYESSRSFVSKRKNYLEKTVKWVHDIEDWINNSSEKRIADFLNLSPNFICKDKIKVFIIGRHNGNYSGDEKPSNNVAWCQWYHLTKIIESNFKKNITITKLFDLIQKENPYNQINESQSVEIKYGNYHIEVVCPPYNQI